jgi:hypothetical protein
MNSNLERLAPLSGVLAVVLMLLTIVIFGFYEYLPTAETLEDFASDNASRIFAAAYLGLISAFAMMWFAGSLFSGLREREGGSGRLSMVAFGGGVASGVALAAGFSAVLAFASRAGSGDGIGLAEAVTLYDLYGNILGGTLAITMSVLIAATAAVSLRKAIFPAWFGWASVLIAIGLLTPIAYIVLALALLWTIYVSIWLYRQDSSAA